MDAKELFSARWGSNGPQVTVSAEVPIENLTIAIAALLIVYQRANTPDLTPMEVAQRVVAKLADGLGQLQLAPQEHRAPGARIIIPS